MNKKSYTLPDKLREKVDRSSKARKILVLVTGMAVVIIFIGYYLLFTNRGSVFLAEKVLSKLTDSDDISIKKSEGSLSNKMSIEDLDLSDLEWLPQGSLLKAKRIDIELVSFFPLQFSAKVHQGLLKIPDVSLVIFYGSYENEQLDINFYTKNFSVLGLANFFPQNNELKRLSGSLEDIDINVKGSLKEPEISGTFLVKEFKRDKFQMSAGPVDFNLAPKDVKENPRLKGDILINGGVVFGDKTAVITLLPGKITFEGDSKNPLLDLKGKTEIEKVRIDIVLKGTLSKPELKLLSDSDMPQERLLIMLATGKKWKGADNLAQNGTIPADLVTDFIDYFVFSGQGSKMVQKLGVNELSLRWDKEAKGVTVKKDITDKTALTYGMEKSAVANGSFSEVHSVGGEYKITDNVSVGVEKKIEKNGNLNGDKEAAGENKVKLEYKKEF